MTELFEDNARGLSRPWRAQEPFERTDLRPVLPIDENDNALARLAGLLDAGSPFGRRPERRNAPRPSDKKR